MGNLLLFMRGKNYEIFNPSSTQGPGTLPQRGGVKNIRVSFQFLHLPQSQTNEKINAIFRGISEWYKYAGNRKRIILKIRYILLYSTAKLYAAKFKISSIKQVFGKQ